MNQILKKTFFFLSFCFLASSLFANNSHYALEPVKPAPVVNQPCTTTTPQCPPEVSGYNAPVLFNPQAPTNLYFTGSFLYWRASGDYLAYALLDNAANPPSIINTVFIGKTIEPHFKYKPGFKAGLGYKLNRDHWDLYAEYTRFHQNEHSAIQAQSNQHIHALWLTFVNPVLIGEGEFARASSSWTIHMDVLDGEVGRSFFAGQHLTFRPSLGLRTLWLDQKYDLSYVPLNQSIVVNSLNKSTSWGIGPRISLNNTWNLYKGFKIFGNLGLSLLHVHEKTSAKQTNPALLLQPEFSEDVTYENTKKLSSLKPNLDLSLGLGWGHAFLHDKACFNLLVSYDYSVFWDQASIKLGQVPIVVPGSNIEVVVGECAGNSGTLSLEGLKISARFDF